MKNANGNDVKRAQQLGKLDPGIMYTTSGGGTKYHYKEVDAYLVSMLRKSKGYRENFVVCESLNGRICAISLDCLVGHKPKGPATTPRKPKNRPKKGTKPWAKIPYRFEDVEVGDIVVYRNAFIGDVKVKVDFKNGVEWRGEAQGGMRDCAGRGFAREGAHILKPCKEPVKPQEEEVYQIGDRFEVTSVNFPGSPDIVMLCMVSSEKAMLITERGNRWTDNTCAITGIQTCLKRDVWRLIDTKGCTYKKI